MSSTKEFVYKNQGLDLTRGVVKRQYRRAGLTSASQLPAANERLKAVHESLADVLGAKTPVKLVTKITGG